MTLYVGPKSNNIHPTRTLPLSILLFASLDSFLTGQTTRRACVHNNDSSSSFPSPRRQPLAERKHAGQVWCDPQIALSAGLSSENLGLSFHE
jgi:hypothetical protein